MTVLRSIRVMIMAVIVAVPASPWTIAQPTETEPLARVRHEWMRAFNARDADAIVALYAPQAMVTSDAGTFVGRAAIRTWVQVSLDQGSRLETIDPVEEKSSGTLAYGAGRSRRLVGTEVHLGRYLIVLEKTGDSWRIVQHASVTER